MRDIELGKLFIEEQRGGTEVAPMSTTANISVAIRYGISMRTLLFKVRVTTFMQYGAELQWLSAFPGESEVCYPPLTYLKPTGRIQKVEAHKLSFTICEVVPHIP